MDWQQLAREYRHGSGVVLFLGAGVPRASGIPSWPELLRGIASRLGMPPGTVDALREAGLSLPAIAEALASQATSDAPFVETVRRALYERLCARNGGESPVLLRPFDARAQALVRREVCARNPSLRAVAAFCARRAGAGYAPNPRVRAVVTTNFDALLEEYVRARYGRRLLRTIERAAAQPSRSRINVYHLNGFLRFDDAAADTGKEASDAVVLTEAQFVSRLAMPFSVFNYTLLALLREQPFVFVGFDLSDDNIRRLLCLSKLEREESRQLAGTDPARAREDALRHFAIRLRPATTRHVELVEASYASLGVRLLWVDDFEEIPARLGEVYGDGWDDVFACDHAAAHGRRRAAGGRRFP